MKKLRFVLADKGHRSRKVSERSRKSLVLGEPCPCGCSGKNVGATLRVRGWGWEEDRFVVHTYV